MMAVEPTWTNEVHDKARLLHDQIAALSVKAAEANDDGAMARVLCAPYYTMLDQLFAEELPWARAMDESDLVVRMRGPAVDEPAPRVKLIADAFDQLRAQMQNIAKAIAGVTTARALPDDLDLGLSGFARGSVIMGLKVRNSAENEQRSMLGEDDPLLLATRAAVRHLGEVTRYVSAEGVAPEFAARFDDPGVRDAVLSAAIKLAPTGRIGIDSVELATPGGEPAGAALTPDTRAALRQAIARPVRHAQQGSFIGTVRELDLDLMRFDLRRISESGMTNLRCAYIDLPEERARALLNATIEVRGLVEFNSKGQPRLLQVEHFEIIEAAQEQGKLDL